MKVGQPARVYIDSNPDEPIEASVSRIDPQATFTPENTYFRDDRVKQVVGVKLQLKGAVGFAKPGMPADGEILVGDSGWPKGAGSRDRQLRRRRRSPGDATAAEAAIRVANLAKRYGEIEAVRGITFAIPQGEIFGLIGPDGAGKTSTFQILAGVMEATSGVAEIFGRPGTRGALPHRLPDPDLQPVSRSHRAREHRVHRRPPTRAPRRGGPARTSLSADVRHGSLHRPARGAAERRHEAEARAGVRAGAGTAGAAARRADDRRRSGVAA